MHKGKITNKINVGLDVGSFPLLVIWLSKPLFLASVGHFWRAQHFCGALSSFSTCCLHFLTCSSWDLSEQKSVLSNIVLERPNGLIWNGSSAHSDMDVVWISGQGTRTTPVTGRKPNQPLSRCTWHWPDFGIIFSVKFLLLCLELLKFWLVSTSENSNNVVRRVWCGPALSPAPTSWWEFLPQGLEITQQWRHTVNFLFLLSVLSYIFTANSLRLCYNSVKVIKGAFCPEAFLHTEFSICRCNKTSFELWLWKAGQTHP